MKAITKDFFREIKNTKSRFLSILVLVALAVAFLSGLRATAPDMKLTGHNYFEEQGLADIQIMSTVGLTDEDLDELLKQEHITKAEATYVIDAFVSGGSSDKVAKVYALPETDINQVLITSGRMAENIYECVVDEDAEWELGVGIGDKVTLSPQESFDDAMTNKEFTIVGVVRSPIYVSYERGSASIGTGKVSCYIYVPKDVFDSEIYTTIFARIDKTSDMIAFYDEYDDYVDEVIDSLEDFGQERADARYSELTGKVDDAQAELDDAKAEADEKLGDAKNTLDKANQDITKGKKEIADADIQIADAEKKLADAEQEVADGEIELADAYKELTDGEKEYEDGYKEYHDGLLEWIDASNSIDSYTSSLNAQKADLLATQTAMQNNESLLVQQYGTMAVNASEAALRAVYGTAFESQKPTLITTFGQAIYDEAYAQVTSGIAQIDAGLAQINSSAADLDSAYYELMDAKHELKDARKELDDGWQEYNDGLKELEDGKQKIADAKVELEDAKQKLADAKITIANGEKDYNKGLVEYDDAKTETDEKISDAQAKIDDAREDLSDISEVKWYILSRSYNPGYSGLGQDADRMGNLAKVFPIIFFLVAALVCLTTMTRMVEEQRIQIGSLKALGYSRFDISKKYIGYGLLPALLGSVLGLVIGYTLFPTMIFTAYQIMYQLPNIEVHQYTNISVACVIAAVACTAIATLAACIATLKESPATLMRPRTPKVGKRVLLEKVTFIWKRLKFIHKVTVRNLFRYQKRFWMTVIGIGGCTALIIAGFGLRSSLTYILQRQYGDLTHYTASITLDAVLKDEKRNAIEAFISSDERIEDHMNVRIASATASTASSSQTIYMYVVDSEQVPLYEEFLDYKTKELFSLGDDGVYIDQKLSELLDVKVGDEIFIDGDEKVYAKVAGIFEHYTAHFVYMTPAYYEQIFGKEADLNGVYMHFTDNDIDFCNDIFEDLMAFEGVNGTSRITDVAETFIESMERIDFVVVIVILSAGALALVVLYNLSNINITERIRELATIKVLGFYDREVSAYVYRENIVLTIFGILAGILMGHYLHTWLVLSVEIDLMMFGRETDPMAYVYAVVLTVAFSVFANILAHYKMKKISMVESLKSAE